MATKSRIEWTESTWNPVTGCSKISPGCKHCYAERMAFRLQAMGQRNYAQGFRLTLQPHALELPLHWKKPQIIFVNSMSDLFHKDVPVEFIQRVFAIMRQAHWHQFQVLTKRSDRLAALHSTLLWTANIWMGVSVEDQDYTFRIYRDAADHSDLVFVGATTAGSYALALRFFAERFEVPTDGSALAPAARHAKTPSIFEEVPDQGNSGQSAVLVRVGHRDWTRDARAALLQSAPAPVASDAVPLV